MIRYFDVWPLFQSNFRTYILSDHQKKRPKNKKKLDTFLNDGQHSVDLPKKKPIENNLFNFGWIYWLSHMNDINLMLCNSIQIIHWIWFAVAKFSLSLANQSKIIRPIWSKFLIFGHNLAANIYQTIKYNSFCAPVTY